MPTPWSGFALEDSNLATTEILLPYTVRVQLHPTPNIVTPVGLDARTREVRLYSADMLVRYGLDAPPLAPLTITDILVDFGSFRLGDTLLPGYPQRLAIPEDSDSHTLYLMSEEGLTIVLVTALLSP